MYIVVGILAAAVIVGGVAVLAWVANEDWKWDMKIDITQKEIDDQLARRPR